MILTIVIFIVVLGFLVFVHEGGHFLAARHVGIRVLQFSIGFPPRMIGRKFGDTELVLSWIPLGGYVRLEGQNIEDENPREPHNWAAKSILQRLYVLVAGPVANLILAFLLMPLVYMIGVETPGYRHTTAIVQSVTDESAAQAAGFMAGDTIVEIEGVETPTWNALYDRLADVAISEKEITMTVQRGSELADLTVRSAVFASSKPFGWRPRIQAAVGQFASDSAARDAGLKEGDRIVAVNGKPIDTWDQLPPAVQSSEGEPIRVTVDRSGEIATYTIQPRFDKSSQRWLIGISPLSVLERHGPIDSFVLGSERLIQITTGTFIFLGRLLSGNGTLDGLGGPVKIGAVIGDAARTSAASLIFLIAVISLQLGIFNLLPIPALDGGHIFMLAIEKIKGTPLSARVRERAQFVGFSLLMALILIVTYNDIIDLMS